MDLWTRIEQAREKWNVLQHPFYQRWSAGELTLDELAVYSGQYRRATEAVARMSANLAEDAPESETRGLSAHAREEADHVAMWDGFVEAVGGNVSDPANSETTECFDVWTRRDGFGPQLARLYAVESGQPEISKTKSMGLSEFYGIEGDPADTYFTVHATMDVEHAEEGRKLIEKYLGEFDEDELVAAAEEAFEANWRLLDGVSAS